MELYRSSDRPRCQIAESLGISDGSLAAWVKEADAADEPGALDANERLAPASQGERGASDGS